MFEINVSTRSFTIISFRQIVNGIGWYAHSPEKDARYLMGPLARREMLLK